MGAALIDQAGAFDTNKLSTSTYFRYIEKNDPTNPISAWLRVIFWA